MSGEEYKCYFIAAIAHMGLKELFQKSYSYLKQIL